ncbi:MAG: hypothetical protein PHN79_06475 [Methanoregula sp.]|nr:hypothetical protein [Methanoregula sp.]
MSVVRKWLVFFVGILIAVLVADACSNTIANYAGITGPTRFVVSFILYVGIFFAILYALEKVFKISFFGFSHE